MEAQSVQQLKSPFQTQIYLVKVPLNVNIVKQDLLHKKQFLKILWSEVWKGGFQLIQILGLLGMYFDAVVAEVKTFLLLFRFWPYCDTFSNLSMTTFSLQLAVVPELAWKSAKKLDNVQIDKSWFKDKLLLNT